MFSSLNVKNTVYFWIKSGPKVFSDSGITYLPHQGAQQRGQPGCYCFYCILNTHRRTHICIFKICQKYLLLSLRRSNALLQCVIYRHQFLLLLVIKTINLIAECVLNYNLLMSLCFLKSNLLLKCTVANIIWWQSEGIRLRTWFF